MPAPETQAESHAAEIAALDAAYAAEIGTAFSVLIVNLIAPPIVGDESPGVRFTKGLAVIREARRLALEAISAGG